MPRKPGTPSPRKYVHAIATLAASAVILPFQGQTWAFYVGACTGYSVLVFGLRHLNQKARVAGSGMSMPTSRILLTHANFLAIVVAWVWLLIALAPHLPYVFRMEDSRRPYFGLAFVGILGLMLLEMIEQKYLRLSSVPGDAHTQGAAARQVATRKTK